MESKKFVDLFASPFLEQTHPLTPTVGSPQVASTARIVAAIVGSVVTVAIASDT